MGQEHITTTLRNALKNDKISHAYLFTGPRGIGKTSVARILAHEVNKLTYTDESNHLDIIEIDAASNRRIDEIRDLRDKVHIAPTSGTYKVYIIDEVHMLTKEAFNALLKTLEEPPAHVIFILATTEAHKLPETIISRTQRFTFKPIDDSAVTEHLRKLASKENIKIEDGALDLIAQHGEGSFRDSISLLDQARSMGDGIIKLENVRQMLGLAPAEAIEGLVTVLGGGSPQSALQALGDMQTQGFQAADIAKQLSLAIREGLVRATLPMRTAEATTLLKKLLDVPGSPNPERLLEIVLLDVVLSHEPKQSQVKQQADRQEQKISPTTPESVPDIKSSPVKSKVLDSQKPKKSNVTGQSTFSLALWPEILAVIKSQHNTLYGVLRMGEPSFDGQTLTLAFRFAFHQKRINEAKNRQIITSIIRQHTNQQVMITCIINAEKAPPPEPKELPKSETNIETISNIFGGAELLD